jgi:Replication initiator protein A
MSHVPKTEPESSANVLLTGRDEMNIAEFPITLLTDRAPKGITKLEHKDQITDLRSGKVITRKLIITAHEDYGLPTSIDDDIILALIQLTKHQSNFSRPDVTFTRRQVIELLGWTDKGRNYDRIEMSLDRWASTYLRYENAWWDNEGRRWTSGGFHIIDSFNIRDGRTGNGQGELFRSQIVWGNEFFKSCQAGYLKSLDYDLYIRLKYHPSKRMLRFLDKRFYHKPDWTFELRDFAIEHVGLSRTYRDAGKIKEKLQPGIEELEEIGFLEPLPHEERYQKEGRNWNIRVVKKQLPPAPPQMREGVDHPLKNELVARGVTESTAIDLVRRYASEVVTAKIDVFDWLAARKDRRIHKSPAGYLVESIRRDFAAPKGFESRAVREVRARQEQEVRRAAEGDRRREAEEHARERAAQEAADRYWATLSQEEQVRLDAAALQAFPLDDQILKSPLRRTFLRSVRAQYLRQILSTRHVAHALFPADPEKT